MKPFLSAVAIWILLTPALAQQAEQPVDDQSPQVPAATGQSGMTQAAAQLAAQSAEEQDSAAPATAEQAPAAEQPTAEQQPGDPKAGEQQPVVEQNAAPQSGEQDPSAQPSEDSAPLDAAQLPDPGRPSDASPQQPLRQSPVQRRALEFPPVIRPRTEAAAYPVNRELQQLSVGARLLSAKEVEQKFSTPLGKHYLVVEVGLFPAGSQTIRVRPDDFTLREGSDDQAFFPATPDDIASALSSHGPHNSRFYPGSGIYGGRGRDVSTGVEVGVGGGPYPRRGDIAGGNRNVMENELRDKSLPRGSLTQPAAGFLYFPLAGKRSAHYNLELTCNGETSSLALPTPNN